MSSILLRRPIQSSWLGTIAITFLAAFNFLLVTIRGFVIAIASFSTARIAKFMIS